MSLAWNLQPLTWILLGVLSTRYLIGWRRLRRYDPALASRRRLAAFIGAVVALILAALSPLDGMSADLLSARAVQKVLVAMVAPLLLWLSCPVHVLHFGLPHHLRVRVTRLLRRRKRMHSLLRAGASPLVAWLLFVTLFLLWHDPAIVEIVLAHRFLRNALLWLLFCTAMLYWWHVVGTGPRTLTRFSGWAAMAYLMGVEIPNMVAGVTIAFATHPLYAVYERVHADAATMPLGLGVLEDQMVAGAVVWVVGSLIYIPCIIAKLDRLFRQSGDEPPVSIFEWSSDDKMRMPGMESAPRLDRDR